MLEELYQQVIIDHSKHPCNFSVLNNATCSKEGYNPLCGDKVTVYLNKAGQTIQDISFQGTGCAISVASASLMTEALKGKSIDEFTTLFKQFNTLVTQGEQNEALGKLAILKGVSEFPMRIKCATLAWHAVKSALTEDKNHEK